MKKKNNKGFTMVELLAVITFIGILATVAIPAVYRYATRARNTSIETMLKSTYEAAETYVMEKNIVLSSTNKTYTIKVKDLVDLKYLEPLYDPATNDGSRCDTSTSSIVTVTYVNTTKGGIINYTYDITLACSQSGTKTAKFPKS